MTNQTETIAVSTRVRLARNIDNFVFPQQMKEPVAKKMVDLVISSFESIDDKEHFYPVLLNEKSLLEKEFLCEKHLISREMVTKEKGAVILRDDYLMSILVNEEDHLRIQALLSGLKLKEAYQMANRLDDLLSQKLTFSQDEKLGYLTACPSNLGTGMRASVMLHLPALREMGYMEGILRNASHIGLAIRGVYGEGSQSQGHLYQISNQMTLGLSESEILDNIQMVADQMIEREKRAEALLVDRLKSHLEDRILRSYGILSHARLIDQKEAMSHLSDIKVGIRLGYLTKDPEINIDDLMIQVHTANQIVLSNRYKEEELLEHRATWLRQTMKQIEINQKESEED